MPHTVDKNKKLATVTRILNSKHFHDSEILKELLNYLVDQALQGVTPKEITIAQELYKNKSFDPAVDSYVRSNMYKLRKRLATFYEKEGQNEKCRLIIPKGSYHVEFVQKLNKKTKGTKPLFWVIIILIMLIQGLIFLLTRQHKQFSAKRNTHQFWRDISANSKPTCFAISDIIMYSEFDEDLERERWIFDTHIYSHSDVDTFIAAHPERQLAPLEFSFVHMSNVPNFMQIAPIFAYNKVENYYKWSSEIEWEDITKNNIVYIGDIRSLHKLQILFDHLHIKVKAPFTFSWVSDTGDTLGIYDFERTEDYRETYSAIIKIPGPNNNVILMLIGNDYPARIFTVDKFTDNAFLDELYAEYAKEFNTVPDYFEMILKVRGFKRTGYNTEILFMQRIKAERFSWKF